MKLFFVHDHPFFIEKKSVFSGGSFPLSLWKNYVKYFSRVIIFGRLSKNLKSKVVKSSGNEACEFYLTKNYQSIFSFFANFDKLKKELLILINQSDIVLVRLPSVLGFLAAYIAKKKGKKIIVEQVGNAKEALSSFGSLVGVIVAPIFEKINKKIVAKADYIVYVTQNKLQKDYPSKSAKTTSISDVIINEIVNFEDVDLARFNDEIFKIGLIGGFDARYKGQNFLIEAISVLPIQIKQNIELFFVGKGDYSWLLDFAKKHKLDDQIKYIGVKESGKEIFDFLDKLSLYIQPSLTEGMPRALIEAMSRGCPVLGSDVGGIPDVVNNEFIHRKGEYKKIAQQIEKLYIDRELLKSESIRSLEFVKPYIKSELDKKRDIFYNEIINDLKFLNKR